jgi:glycosyltransferase involved in cell wall biosynthesis
MTILWIYNQPLIPEAGGTERITSLVAKGLSERGYRCLGILEFKESDWSMTYNDKPVDNLYNFLKANNVDVVINQIAYAKWLLEAFLANGGNQWHAEGGRIISCLHFDPCNPSYIQLLRSQERLSIKDHINIIKHTILWPYYLYKKQKSEGSVYNYIYDNSDSLIALSKTHFPYLNKVMCRQDYSKLTAIGNPLTFEVSLSSIDFDNKQNTILVCARMSEYHKRITFILRAWLMLYDAGYVKNWTLKIVGDGPDLERYKRFTSKHRLKNVEFLGHQNPEPYYLEAKILLLTSSAEGWGLALTEAMQYGIVPVVMDSSSVYNEIITPLEDGILTTNNDIKLYAKAIKQLIDDPHSLDRMQRNALLSSKKFTLDNAIDKWEKLLKQL